MDNPDSFSNPPEKIKDKIFRLSDNTSLTRFGDFQISVTKIVHDFFNCQMAPLPAGMIQILVNLFRIGKNNNLMN